MSSPDARSQIEVLYCKSNPIDTPGSSYDSFKPSITLLSRGFRKAEGFRPFPVDTIWERDVKIPMRDGVTLYADVFRPADTSHKVPAIIPWSPYGKNGTGLFSLDVLPYRIGVPKSRTSGFESFEAPDPAEWTQYGYAIVNIDARGAFMSEGDTRWYGTSEAQDGYDTIEYVAGLSWCSGKVATMGNSWLGTAQWFIAAERPPHLTCILPLEGNSDCYRETLARGGVPAEAFWIWIRDLLLGNTKTEDVASMLKKYPLMNDYWESKRAKMENVQVPAYISASMSSQLHTEGSFRGFEEIVHDDKWLRVHSTQEWYDLYHPESVKDFRKFLDFFMKDVQNDWRSTPKVRISFLRFNKPAIDNIPFTDYPIPKTQHVKFYLSGNKTLKTEDDTGGRVASGSMSYRSDALSLQMDDDEMNEVVFSYTFPSATRLMGPARATIYLSCNSSDDMDVFTSIRKADSTGRPLRNVNISLEDLGVESAEEVQLTNPFFYLGPSGILRASHRTLADIGPEKKNSQMIRHDHSKQIKIPPGQVVKLEMSLWPAAIQWEAGEKLLFKVGGHPMTLAELELLRGQFKGDNAGDHVLHFGGEYASFIEVPFVAL